MRCGTREAWLPICLWFCVLLRSLGHSVVSFLLAGQSGCLSGTGPLQLRFTIWFLCLWVCEEVGCICLSLGAHYMLPTIFGENWDPWALCPRVNLKTDQRLASSLGEKGLRTDKLRDCVCFISLGSQDSKGFFKIKFSLNYLSGKRLDAAARQLYDIQCKFSAYVDKSRQMPHKLIVKASWAKAVQDQMS